MKKKGRVSRWRGGSDVWWEEGIDYGKVMGERSRVE